MKNSSESSRLPHSAKKSRFPLGILMVSVVIVTAVASLSWFSQHTVSDWKRYQGEMAARAVNQARPDVVWLKTSVRHLSSNRSDARAKSIRRLGAELMEQA